MPTEFEKRQIAAIGGELRGVVEGAAKDIARSLMTELPATTPKDTGLTAANWRASRGRPVSEPVGSRSASGVASAKGAQDASRAEIDRFKLGDGTLNVSNPLPSAEALNRGSSSQEPAAFVQRGIAKAVATAKVKATARGPGGGAAASGNEPLLGLLKSRSGAQGGAESTN